MRLGILLCALACPVAAQMRVTLLGTGNPRPDLDRFGPATLIEAGEHRLLVDCGRGVPQRLFQLDVPLPSVNLLLLTHLHSDHVVGLPDFWLTGWLFGRRQPVEVFGPRGTAAMMRHLERAFAFDVHMRRDVDERLPAAGAVLQAREVREGLALERSGLRVLAFAVDHGPPSPALGYRVEFQGRSVVLSGDTRPSENLVKFARGADLVIHEVVAPEAERRRARVDPALIQRIIDRHTTAEDAGKLFARIRPRLAVFSHIVPSVAGEEDILPDARKHYDGPLVCGRDLMRIAVGEKVEVLR